jgi:tetratricopeptide (TPR) repeat protein
LDVILEQGFVGGIAILVVILGGIWMLINRDREKRGDLLIDLLSEAVVVSTLILLIHGLVDDPLYGDAGTPLLLLLPGLALMLVYIDQPVLNFAEQKEKKNISSRRSGLESKRLVIPVILLIIALALGGILQRSLLASWYANLGAVEMSRWELKNWPQDQWNDNPDVSPLEPAELKFEQALTYSSRQRTASHRLGLISMQRRDFDTAQIELGRAYEIDPKHRGIRKSLGYAYVWGDRLQRARLLLDEIDEAKQEMKVYSWWWEEKDRLDLSSQADEMVSLLEAINQ